MMIGPRRMTSAGRQLRDGISPYLRPENRHRLAREPRRVWRRNRLKNSQRRYSNGPMIRQISSRHSSIICVGMGSYWHLYRAVTGENENFDHKTLLSWVKGAKVPRSLDSFEILSRIERRDRLPNGYLKGKLPPSGAVSLRA